MLLSLMILLAVVIGLVVAWPWLQRHLPVEQARRAANVAAYRTRVEEVEANLAAGATDAATAQALQQEAASRLLEDEAEESVPARRRGRYALLGIALALIPIIIAGVWYVQQGSWRTAQEIATGRVAHQTRVAEKHKQTRKLNHIVKSLQAELRKHPEKARDWALLGRSEMALGHYPESAQAYAQANKLSANSNAQWLIAQGLSQGMVQKRSLQGKPAALFEAALEVAPDDARALWYSGVAAAQIGDDARARKRWTKLMAQPDMPADVRAAIKQQMASISGSGKASPSTATPTDPVVMLDVDVRVAPQLKKHLPAHATLFVYARAPGGGGMPLAATRVTTPQFPQQVKLDDANNPMPGTRLEGHDKLELVARLSRSGKAEPQSGDLEGRMQINAQAGKNPVTLTIDKRVP